MKHLHQALKQGNYTPYVTETFKEWYPQSFFRKLLISETQEYHDPIIQPPNDTDAHWNLIYRVTSSINAQLSFDHQEAWSFSVANGVLLLDQITVMI